MILYVDSINTNWAPPSHFLFAVRAGWGFHHRKRAAVDRRRRLVSTRPTGRREKQPVGVAVHKRRPGGSKGEPDTAIRMYLLGSASALKKEMAFISAIGGWPCAVDLQPR